MTASGTQGPIITAEFAIQRGKPLSYFGMPSAQVWWQSWGSGRRPCLRGMAGIAWGYQTVVLWHIAGWVADYTQKYSGRVTLNGLSPLVERLPRRMCRSGGRAGAACGGRAGGAGRGAPGAFPGQGVALGSRCGRIFAAAKLAHAAFLFQCPLYGFRLVYA